MRQMAIPTDQHVISRNAGDPVERKLHRAWKKERRFHHTRGLAIMLLWIVALIVLDLLVDWLTRPPGWGRMVLLAVNVAVLGVVFYRNWWRHLIHYDPVRVALEVEGRHPELESLLVSYVQVGHGSPADVSASPDLISALRRAAVDVTRPMDFREIISYKRLERVLLICGVVLALFVAANVRWSEVFAVLLARLLNPAATTKYPTRTNIVKITGDTTARQGDTVEISARCAGHIPSRGTLMVRPEGGEWEPLGLRASSHGLGTFSYNFMEVFQSFEYYVRIGDAKSDPYRVTVVPAPHIVSTKVHLKYPQYTGQDPKTTDDLNLEAPEGAEVQWELRLDQRLARAQMIRRRPRPRSPDGARATPTTPATEVLEMSVDPDGHTVRFSTQVGHSFPYRFRWTEAAHQYVYEESIRHNLTMLADLPPEAEIVHPLLDEKATVRKTLEVRFRARDDHGVAKAWIVYSVNEQPEQLKAVAIGPSRDVVGSDRWRLRASLPKLAEGDVITYAIEVADNRNGGKPAQVRRSSTRQLQIVSVAEYLAYMLEKSLEAVEEIRALHEQETEASKQVGDIRANIEFGPTTRPEPK